MSSHFFKVFSHRGSKRHISKVVLRAVSKANGRVSKRPIKIKPFHIIGNSS